MNHVTMHSPCAPTARSAFFISVALLLSLAFYSYFSILHSQAADVKKQDVEPDGFPELTAGEQVLNIPYFVLSEEMQSTLTLNNNQTMASTVVVTIFNAKGVSLATIPMTLQATTVTRFKLDELLKHVSGNSREGNIQISYYGAGMSVTSQLSIASPDTRLSFESNIVGARDFASTRLDGIVWVPDEKSEAKVALTNTQSSSFINVTIRSGEEQQIVSLGPRETSVVDLGKFLTNVKKSLRPGLVSLEHDGAPGSLIATGFVLNRKTGFSSNLTFVDCGTVKSMKLAAAHVRLGPADPTEGFPPETEFRAPLLIANTMDKPTDVQVSVDYTIGGQANRVQLNPITLAPLEVKQIELSREIARNGVTEPLDDAGVDISYDGMPGTVIGRLTSYDISGDYSFDAPVKDPMAGANRSNGSYPWRLDNGYTTVLHLKNTIEKNVDAVVQIRYDGGSYNLDLVKLAPYQTVAVDIRQLRDNQKEDIRGAVMPKDVESGQVVWYEQESGSLIGRAQVANIKAGISSTFSCPGGCPCGLVFSSGLMTPSSGSAFVGDSGFMFAPSEMRKDCNFITYGPYTVTANEWFTSNASVATVTNSGIETCMSPGNTTITAKWPTVVAYNSYMCGCCPINGYGTAPANCDVQCRLPTGETSTSGGWDSSMPTIHKWNQTLTGPGNFVGRDIAENTGSTGASDTCHWPDSEIPKAQLSGGAWTVTTGNNWGPDLVGYTPAAINYYRQHGRASCQATVPQDMFMDCPDMLHKYTAGPLVFGITATEISIKRHSADTQTKAWP